MRRISGQNGQILPMVMITLVVMIMIIFGLVFWSQNDTSMAVKQQKSTTASNLAEAGINRGTWKLQSSTPTWAAAVSGNLSSIASGYNFDTTYTDIPGGTYRIKITSGPTSGGSCTTTSPCVTVVAEGRDNNTKEVRAVQAVFKNQTIYSAMMSGGNVNWSKGLVIFWGPIIAQGNIALQDDVVGSMYFPRKFAKGVVTGPPSGNYNRDTNGLTPPNTDNVEWWSGYSGVPNVPVLDFVSLRSSAAATGTLNVYGCRSTQGGAGTNNSATRWDIRASCGSSGAHTSHFGNPWSHPKSAQNSPGTDYVWYWDSDVTLSGGTNAGESCGLRGSMIVRGNLTIDTPGEYQYTGAVPANAWQEENKLLQNTFDTSAAAEYPADTGLHQTAATFRFGLDTFAVPGLGGGPYHTTVGMRGFTYVGGNLTIINYMDFNGALWVNGSVTASNGSVSNSCGVFYNDSLIVPALNVVLLQQSWQEVHPSSVAWP